MKKEILPLGVIFLICFLIVSIWFKDGLMFAGGEDVISFYNPSLVFDLFFYTWNPPDSGTPQLSPLARIPYFYAVKTFYELGVPGVFLQALTFFILMSTGTIATYFLLKVTLFENLPNSMKKTVPFFGSVFYLLNPYSMSQIWIRGLYNQFFSFALVPIFLLFFILGLKKKKIKYGLVAIITTFVFSTAYTHPSTVIAVWTLPLIYLLFYLFESRNNFKNILFGLFYITVIFTFWILVNAFWIYPFILEGKQIFSSALDATKTDNIGMLQGISKDTPIISVLRLLHDGLFFRGLYFGDVYLSIPFTLISFLIPLVSLFSIPMFRKFASFKFYIVAFLVGLFVSTGDNPPLGWLLILILKKLTFLQVFRNTYEKFGINFLIAYTTFFAIGLVVFSVWLSKKLNKLLIFKTSIISFLLLILISGIFVWPIWTGKFVVEPFVNPWIRVPSYYKEVDNWLNTQKGDFQLLQLPLTSGDGIRYTWEHTFQGIEPSHYFFQKPSVRTGYYFINNYYAPIGEHFVNLREGEKVKYVTDSREVLDEIKIIEGLSALNIRYIILHNDVDYKFSLSPSPDRIREYFSKQEDIKFVKKIGQIEIYEIEPSKNQNIIYSPDAETEILKKDPTFYKINVKNAKDEINLHFLQTFNTGWELFLDNQLITTHEKVLSYANGWKIRKGGNYTLTLQYKPQLFVYTGLKVSLISLSLIILVIIVNLFRTKVRKLIT